MVFFPNRIPSFIISPITKDATFSKIIPKDSVRTGYLFKMIRITGPHTWQQHGVPFFKFLSSLHGKKEGEKRREGEGRGEQERGKKIRYSLGKNYYQYNDYSLQQDLLQ